jgi:hypothetical protein
MVHGKTRGKNLETVREALASWRRLHGGRGRAIPASLWSDAAIVARTMGVAETARALRVAPGKLAKLVEGRTEGAAGSVIAPATFVELGALGLGAAHEAGRDEAGRVVLELVGREGDRVRVELVGDGGREVDVVALARAFWSRGV